MINQNVIIYCHSIASLPAFVTDVNHYDHIAVEEQIGRTLVGRKQTGKTFSSDVRKEEYSEQKTGLV